MLNLISIIKKNLKMLYRSKLSAAAIVITPLLIVLLAGTAFNSSSLQGVQISVYRNGSGNLTEEIIEDLEGEDYLIRNAKSKEECKGIVKDGDSQICLVFPKKLEGNKLDIYADNSRMDVAYFLMDEINSKVSSLSKEIGSDRASKILNSTDKVISILREQKEEVSSILDEVEDMESKAEDISSSTSNLSEIEDDLEDIKSDVESLDTNESVDSITEDIDAAILSLPGDLDDDAEDIKDSIGEIENDLENIESGLEEAISELETYEGMSAGEISSPLQTEVLSLTPNTTNWKYLFPTFISLVVLLGSLILGSTIVMREKKSKAYFRNFITSTSSFTFFMGIYITCLIVLLLQIAIVFSSLIFILGMSISGIVLKILLFVLLSGTVFIFMGMTIGYLFNSEETIVLTSISMASLLIFFSNIILPAEAISGTFKNIARYNPLVIVNSVLRKVVLFNSALSSLLYEILILGGFIVALFVVALGLKILTKRKVNI